MEAGGRGIPAPATPTCKSPSASSAAAAAPPRQRWRGLGPRGASPVRQSRERRAAGGDDQRVPSRHRRPDPCGAARTPAWCPSPAPAARIRSRCRPVGRLGCRGWQVQRDGFGSHGVFVVSIGGQMNEKTCPNARFRSAAAAEMDAFPISKPLRQVTPGNACATAKQRHPDEQTIISRCHANVVLAAREQAMNLLPLIIPKAVAPRELASEKAASSSIRALPCRNPLINGTP